MISLFGNTRPASWLVSLPLPLPLPLLLLVLEAGCAAEPLRIHEPIGPAPQELAGAATDDGKLVVHTAEATTNGDIESYGGREYGPYAIEDSAGRPLRTFDRSSAPEAVSLPPGDYLVRGSLSETRPVEVPVRIVKGRTTTVYLDGSVRIPVRDRTVAQVYGPDGSVVGWRAR